MRPVNVSRVGSLGTTVGVREGDIVIIIIGIVFVVIVSGSKYVLSDVRSGRDKQRT